MYASWSVETGSHRASPHLVLSTSRGKLPRRHLPEYGLAQRVGSFLGRKLVPFGSMEDHATTVEIVAARNISGGLDQQDPHSTNNPNTSSL